MRTSGGSVDQIQAAPTIYRPLYRWHSIQHGIIAIHRLQSQTNGYSSRVRYDEMADEVLFHHATYKELSLWESSSAVTDCYTASTVQAFNRARKNSQASSTFMPRQHQISTSGCMLVYKSLSIAAAAESPRHNAAPGFGGHDSAAARLRLKYRLCFGQASAWFA